MENENENSRSSSYDNLSNLLTEDPNLSKLAKNMFQKTSDFLNYEVRMKSIFVIG